MKIKLDFYFNGRIIRVDEKKEIKMLRPEMNFYYWKEGDKIVVQNMVMGMKGQEHTHTIKEFEVWKKDIPKKNLIKL